MGGKSAKEENFTLIPLFYALNACIFYRVNWIDNEKELECEKHYILGRSLCAGVMVAWGVRIGTWMFDCPRIWILADRPVLSCFESDSHLQFVYFSCFCLVSFRVPRYKVSDRVPENIHPQRHTKYM